MGWIKRTRDTGLRDITGQITGAEVVSGRLLVRRRREKLIVTLDELTLAESSANVSFPRLTGGFAPLHLVRAAWHPSTAWSDPSGTLRISTSGYFNIYYVVGARAISARVEVEASGAFPSSFPGAGVPS